MVLVTVSYYHICKDEVCWLGKRNSPSRRGVVFDVMGISFHRNDFPRVIKLVPEVFL